WDLTTGRVRLRRPDAEDFEFTPDGQALVVTHVDPVAGRSWLSWWELDTGRERRHMPLPSGQHQYGSLYVPAWCGSTLVVHNEYLREPSALELWLAEKTKWQWFTRTRPWGDLRL